MKDMLTEMFSDWGLDFSKLTRITCDNGSKMIKAAELANWNRLSCFGHNLHNAVNRGLKADGKIGKVIGTYRNVCQYLDKIFNFAYKMLCC